MAHVIKKNEAVLISATRDSADSSLSDDALQKNIGSSDEKVSVPENTVKTAEQYQQYINELESGREDLESKNARLSQEMIEMREKLANFEADIDSHRKQGFEKGEEEGYAQGLSRVDAQVDESLQQIRMLIDALDREFREQFLMKEEDIKEVIMSALLKLIGSVPTEDIVKLELERVIQSMSKTEEMYVHMSNEDFDKLQATEYAKRLPACISFVADNKVLPGGIIVQAQSESLDARLERKLVLFKDQLVSA